MDSRLKNQTALSDNLRNKAEYGDFQTPLELARRICRWLKAKGIQPDVLVEPTFGQGHFILAALEIFPSLRFVYGVEIHEPYVLKAKESLGQLLSGQENREKPAIHLFQDNVFQFPFEDIAKKHCDQQILVLGNPPWATNTMLSAQESGNIPKKSNFKSVSGIEAITGKGNFDIGESVTLAMLDAFSQSQGWFAFLVKNIVVRNIVHSQKSRRFCISRLQQIAIDAKKHFNASVDASLFFAQLNQEPATTCSVSESFDEKSVSSLGWVAERFVANIEKYNESADLDGTSPNVWRQGIKHDCSRVMELTKSTSGYENLSGESISLEEDLVYPLVKSSDLKKTIITTARKFVIVPQKFVGQETDDIKKKCPKTYSYLDKHRDRFEGRKSSIYRGKPPFSIFGIGEYSFRRYKIAISGLYKQTYFSLIPPIEDKPAMLDDTCYFLGWNTLAEAVCALCLLNHPRMQELFRSLIFWEGKRTITKEIVMRLDYSRLVKEIPFDTIIRFANENETGCDENQLREKWKEMQKGI